MVGWAAGNMAWAKYEKIKLESKRKYLYCWIFALTINNDAEHQSYIPPKSTVKPAVFLVVLKMGSERASLVRLSLVGTRFNIANNLTPGHRGPVETSGSQVLLSTQPPLQ